MEKIEEDRREEQLKCQTAIRCAKATLLLSSLKTATNCSTATTVHQLEDMQKIQKLKIELVKEIHKYKYIRRNIGVLLLSYFLVVLIFLFVKIL